MSEAEVANSQENTPAHSYKAPAQQSVADIVNKDSDDPSLVKYKQQLLGDMDDLAYDKNDPRKIIVTKIEIHSPELEEARSIDIVGLKEGEKAGSVTIKEGAKFHVEVLYHVQHEIVSGLKYKQVVKCKGIKVDEDGIMIGSFAPRKEHYTYKSVEEEAQKGMLARQKYNVHSKFVDDDKITHISFDWKFEIAKDW